MNRFDHKSANTEVFSTMKVLCILLACVAASSAAISRIVGGTTTTIDKIPFQLSLAVNDEYKCGAVIISTKIALTSAQCVSGVAVSKITLRAGSSYRTTQGNIHAVSSVVIHPNYSTKTHDYDIAVLKIATTFLLGTNIGVATLPSVDEIVAAGSIATVSGWGRTTKSGTTYANQLQVATVPIVTSSVCATTLSVTDRMICAGYTTGGKDICTGDTGGPLVYGGKLVGLVSWEAGCGTVGSTAVYTGIAALRAWIKTQTGV